MAKFFSLAGLIADAVGFIILAFEWHRTFKYTEEIRQAQLHDAYERNRAREEGREPEFRMQAEEELMAKEFSKLRRQESTFRQRLFFFGVVLIVVGFLFQSAGTLMAN